MKTLALLSASLIAGLILLTPPTVGVRTVSTPGVASEAVQAVQEAPVAAAEVVVPTTAAPVAAAPVAPATPATTPTSAPYVPPAVTPPIRGTICEITHVVYEQTDTYGVYGATGLPRGTVFTFTLTVDGTTRNVALTARAGAAQVNGTTYGNPDGYTDNGGNVFGSTQQDMVSLPAVHGLVSAVVTQGGATVC